MAPDAERRMAATAMVVDFGLFRNDDLLCRAAVRLEAQEKLEEFDYGWRQPDGADQPVAAGHLVVRHQFALPAASLSIALVQFSSAEGNPDIVLQAALAIGVHDSDDWESVALGGDYTFAFLCRRVK
jgi:hypothetical protein